MRSPTAFLVAAPRSGEGKTTVSLALILALKRAGLAVRACKCGPDYVDPTLLAEASGAPCPQLDTWLMGADGVRSVFARQSADCDVVLVEGVMGLMDGRRPGSLEGSSLDVARVLGLPVLLCVNARGLAASLAPLVEGFQLASARHGVHLAGIIATRTGSDRHVAMLAAGLTQADLPPLVCALRRSADVQLPSRQLGLVPAEELRDLRTSLDALGKLVSDEDVDNVLAAVRSCQSGARLPVQDAPLRPVVQARTLAVAQDRAFCFYYEENFTFLKALGWKLVFFSPLADRSLPPCDAIYLGGGYPEVFAARLAENAGLRATIRRVARDGLPVYAECGGYMYLAERLKTADGRTWPMCGVVPAVAVMGGQLRSLGYREVKYLAPLPFGLDNLVPGRRLRGHEFHWSDMTFTGDRPAMLYTETRDGVSRQDGVITGPYGNVLASYLHAWLPSVLDLNKDSAGASARGTARDTGAGCGTARLVLVTGPSSAGKTTLIQNLAEILRRRGQDTRIISLDGLLGAFGALHPVTSLEEAERLGLFSAAQYHRLVRAAAERANGADYLLCDHVLCGNASWTRDMAAQLGDLAPDCLELVCPEEVLAAREMARSDRGADAGHAVRQLRNQLRAPLRQRWAKTRVLDAAAGRNAVTQAALRLLEGGDDRRQSRERTR